MNEIILAVILFLIAAFAFFMSALSFMERGILFNNAYIYASKEEREAMNKKPHYRQSAIVFLLIASIFLLNGISVLFNIDWIFYIVIGVVLTTLAYAIISSIKIENDSKKR